jgi:hypothetical protein
MNFCVNCRLWSLSSVISHRFTIPCASRITFRCRGCQDFASSKETNCNHPTTKPFEVVTVNLRSLITKLHVCNLTFRLIPLTALSRMWVCGRSLAGFESRRGHGCPFLVRVGCCQVDVFASDWSPVQRSPTECNVSEYDRKASIMRRSWPIRSYCAMERDIFSMDTDLVKTCILYDK